LERIAVREFANVSRLKIDGAAVELGNVVGVIVGGNVKNWLIGLELVGAVTEPHGVNIARGYKS
jgi:hypothetical protein